MEMIFQSDNTWESLSSTDNNSVKDWYKSHKSSEAWTSIKKLYTYTVCLVLHGPEKCKEKNLRKLADDCLLKQVENVSDVVVNIISLTKSLFTNFYQCVQSGQWSEFFHSESTYEKWYNDNLEVERRFSEQIVPNDAHDLITQTELLLKQGKEMINQMRQIGADRKEILAVNNRYLRTYEIFLKFKGTIAAAELRRSPFALLVTGRSKIGKTSFLEINNLLYASLHGKDKEVRPYIRKPGEKHWNGFQSNQWALIFDDVCAHNPNQVLGVEEFHKEVLHIFNNIAALAECAALEDKGTKPILCDLVQITSNVHDLHGPIYFTDTAALFRRLQFRVTLKLRPEYMCSEGWLDPSKIPHLDGYPDFWLITVEKAYTYLDITQHQNDDQAPRERGGWENVEGMKEVDMWTYINWFKAASTAHKRDQNQFLDNMRALKETFMCQVCGLPGANHPEGLVCGDLELQSDNVVEYVAEADFSDIPVLESDSETDMFHGSEMSIFEDADSDENFDIDPMSTSIEEVEETETPERVEYRFSKKKSWKDWAETKLNTYVMRSEMVYRRRSRQLRHALGMDEGFYASALQLAILISHMTKAVYGASESTEKTPIIYFVHALTWLKGFFATRMILQLLLNANFLIGIPLAIFIWCISFPVTACSVIGMDQNFLQLVDNFNNWLILIAAVRARDYAEIVRMAGRKVFTFLGGTKMILSVIAILTTGLMLLYALLHTFIPHGEKAGAEFIPQGALFSNMKHGTEPENVWRMHDYKCDVLEPPKPSSSLKGASTKEIVGYFQRFLVRVQIRWESTNPLKLPHAGGTGILLGGQDILLPTHFFDRDGDKTSVFDVTVFYSTRHNVVRQASCKADSYSLRKYDEMMSILTFPAMPAGRAIQTNIPTKDFLNYIGPGLRIGRDRDGNLIVDDIKRISCCLVNHEPQWTSGVDKEPVTDYGDCGSVLLACTNKGPVLVGVHMWLKVNLYDTASSGISYNFCGKKFGELISQGELDLRNTDRKVGELVPLHHKSPIQYLDDLGGMQVFGSFTGFRTRTKSKVVETIGADYLKEKCGFEHTHGPPVMLGREVKFLHLQDFKRSNASVPEAQAEIAMSVFLQHVLNYSDEWKVYILSQKDAVNGVPGVRFIDRIPMMTSCGYPYKQPKYKKIFPVVDGDWTSELVVDDDIQTDIDYVMHKWENHTRAYPVFTAALKDEARKFAKIQAKATRIFYGGPVGLIIAERMLFSWFTRLVQTNPLIFMQAPGMDATGSQWDLLYKFMAVTDLWIAGDFKAFDISMIVQFLRMAYKFIILLAKHLGADAHHVRMMEVAAEDLIDPVVDYFGDLIMGKGKNPSGHALTVIINGLVNVLYMIHCFITLHPNFSKTKSRFELMGIGEEFFRDVRAMFYGDDNFMNVAESARWFNHTAISDYLHSLGVTYTMAEKGEESVPFIPASKVTFLKRSFRYEEDVQGYVAPLDVTSIHKALMLTIPSGVISKEQAYMDCIVSQNDAMWHHGREKFEAFQLILNGLIEHCNLEQYMYRKLLNWDELRARWIATRDNVENRAWTTLVFQSDSHIERIMVPHWCDQCRLEHINTRGGGVCGLCGACSMDNLKCFNCLFEGHVHDGARIQVMYQAMTVPNRVVIGIVCDCGYSWFSTGYFTPALVETLMQIPNFFPEIEPVEED
jgi:hypothetical protein